MPRVGSEVLVQFLEGDLDEPIITGALYSKDNPTPFEKDFPHDKERRHLTGFRSASEKGKIYHELYWFDKSGSEYMKIAAPKLIQMVSETYQLKTRDSIFMWSQNSTTSRTQGGDSSSIIMTPHSIHLVAPVITSTVSYVHHSIPPGSAPRIQTTQKPKVPSRDGEAEGKLLKKIT